MKKYTVEKRTAYPRKRLRIYLEAAVRERYSIYCMLANRSTPLGVRVDEKSKAQTNKNSVTWCWPLRARACPFTSLARGSPVPAPNARSV